MANGFVTTSPTVRHGTSAPAGANNWLWAERFTAPTSSRIQISEIGVWTQDSGYNFKLAIFTDDAANTCPDTMVLYSESDELTNNSTLTKVYHTYTNKPRLNGGTDYWLCIFHNEGQNVDAIVTGGSGIMLTQRGDYTYDVWPSGNEWHTNNPGSYELGIYAVWEDVATFVVDPDNGIGTDYTDLTTAISTEAGDQGGSQPVFECRCTGGTTDDPGSSAPSVTGYTNTGGHYVRIHTPSTYRHNGVFTTGNFYRLRVGNSTLMSITQSGVEIDGIAFTSDQTSGYVYGIFYDSYGYVDIVNCLFTLDNPTSIDGGAAINNGGGTTADPYNVVNNIIYNWNVGGIGWAIYVRGSSGDPGYAYVYNNTVVDCGGGIRLRDSYQSGKNNLIFNTDTADWSVSQYDHLSNNASEDDPSYDSNWFDLSSYSGSAIFEDYDNDNFHLSSTSPVIGQGSGLEQDSQYPVTTDFEGDSRDSTTPDIGFDEYTEVQASGVVVTPSGIWSISGTINPSLEFSSILFDVGAINAVSSTVNPDVVFGSLSFSPEFLSALTSSLDPAIVKGNITITPSGEFVLVSTQDPNIVLGSIDFGPGFSSAITNVLDPGVSLGSISFTPTYISAIVSSINPQVIKGSLSLQPDGSFVVASSTDPNTILGSILLTPNGSEVIASSADPSITFGSVLIIPGQSSTIAQSSISSILEGGNIAFVPEPSSGLTSTQQGQIVLGTMQVQPNGSVSIVSTSDPTTILGSLTLSDSAIAYTQTVDPNTILGAINITPQEVIALTDSILGDVELSSLTITPSFSDAITISVDPSVSEGGLLFTPQVATAISNTIGPTTILGSLILSPTAIQSIVSTIGPITDVVVIPAAITAISTAGVQNTVLGSLIIAPDGSVVIAQTTDPTTTLSDITQNICIRPGNGLSLVTDGFLIPCSGPTSTPIPTIVRVESIEGKVESIDDLRAALRTKTSLSGTVNKIRIIGKKVPKDSIKVKITDKEPIKGKVN